MRDYSQASMLFEIIYNLLIWSHFNRKVACCVRHLHFCWNLLTFIDITSINLESFICDVGICYEIALIGLIDGTIRLHLAQ